VSETLITDPKLISVNQPPNTSVRTENMPNSIELEKGSGSGVSPPNQENAIGSDLRMSEIALASINSFRNLSESETEPTSEYLIFKGGIC